MAKPNQRSRIFIDRPVQSALLLRASLYWAVTVMTQQLIVLLFVVITSFGDDFQASGARLWWHLQLSVLAALAILPVLLLDILKLSHRWVGPVFRLRSSLHALSHGERVPPIRFREGDFWQGLAGDLNVVTAELNRRRSASEPEEGVNAPPAATKSECLRALEHESDLTSTALI